jgi:hypothetical protein
MPRSLPNEGGAGGDDRGGGDIDATFEAQEDEEGNDGFGEDEDVTNEMDEAYKKALNGVSGWNDDMAKFLMGDFDDDGDDVDEDFSSPLDAVDELLYLSDTMTAAFAMSPDYYQQIQQSMPPGTVEAVQRIFAAANAIRAAQEQQQQQHHQS